MAPYQLLALKLPMPTIVKKKELDLTAITPARLSVIIIKKVSIIQINAWNPKGKKLISILATSTLAVGASKKA